MVSAEAIERAIAAHLRWKRRLEEAILTGESDFTVARVAGDSVCELGQWLHSMLDDERRSRQYKKVRKLHADFHKTSAKILELALQGKRKEAAAHMELGNEYTLASGNLTLALKDWIEAD
jgi:hypothetical protein